MRRSLLLAALLGAPLLPFNRNQVGFQNNIVGALEAGNVIINGSGEFIYSGPPASGNLIYANAPIAGTDNFSNPYYAGETIFAGGNGVIVSYNGITGWYAPTAALGNLKMSMCAYSLGVDQFGNHVPIGPASFLISGASPVYTVMGGNGFLFVGPLILGAPGMSGPGSAPTTSDVQVSSGHVTGATPVTALFADSALNTVAQLVIAAVANPVALTKYLVEIQGSLNVNNGKAGNVFAVGTGPSDFAGTVYLEDTTAPATPGTASAMYSGSGQARYVSEDGNNYSTGTKIVQLAAQTITAITPTLLTGATVNVNAQQYQFRAFIQYHGGVAASTPGFVTTGPATSAAVSGFRYTPNGGGAAPAGGTALGSTNTGPTFQTAQGFYEFWGEYTFSAAGTITLEGLTGNAADSLIIVGGYMELIPI